MIKAKDTVSLQAVESKTFDHWTPVAIQIQYQGPGKTMIGIRLARSRIVDKEGNTETHPDSGIANIIIPDINADPTDNLVFTPEPYSPDPQIQGLPPDVTAQIVTGQKAEVDRRNAVAKEAHDQKILEYPKEVRDAVMEAYPYIRGVVDAICKARGLS